jgi:hypothetical protein
MLGFAFRGLAAGAAGTTALNAATYADMAIRGRGASSMPETAVEQLAERAGYSIPGEGDERQNRLSGLGALSGIATGTAAGVAASMLGPVVRRLPLPLGAVVVGAMAMAGSDVPMSQLGLSDPSSWSKADWLSDALPHLAFGAAAVWTLRALGKSRG